MLSLRQIISSSTGLKITYVGFAAYALHTLAKFYLSPPDSSSPLNILIMLIGILGLLGLIAALISMIFTGIRGVHRNGLKSWWTLWAILGLTPFLVTAMMILSFSMMVKDSRETILNNDVNLSHLKLLGKTLDKIKAKKASPRMISKVSQLYAKDTYLYKGEIVEYLDEAGNLVKFQPTEQDIRRRIELKEMPQKTEEAQHGRTLEVAFWFAVPLLAVIASFLVPMRKTI